jgi:UDP-N-acetylmuramoyl-L-alanyl-D-glutamate--2,6-diaminopimelate ligase
LEVVAREPFRVLIDFAHTPHALERVLATLRPLVAGRLIVLFGAGGDRDPGKRPLMGRAVASGADLAIVTSDNPRTEDPDAIIDGIVGEMGDVEYQREADRKKAIALALESARIGDLVLLAGKGHEAYQVVGTEKHLFDEAAIVRAALAAQVGAS